MEKLKLSPLPKTWVLDLDGTLVVHNGYKNGGDVLLDGVKEFYNKIAKEDKVVVLTAREEKYKEQTIAFLNENNLHFNDILFGYPTGERILVNDEKPSGLKMSHSVNKKRDEPLNINFEIDENL